MFLSTWLNGTKEWVVTPNWWMLYNYSYFRRIRVNQERVRWYRDIEEPVKLRKRRGPVYLDPWTIEKNASIMCSKSWKHLYKIRKQWQKPKYN